VASGREAAGREPTPADRAASAPDALPPVPRITLVLMAIFVVGGSIGLTLDWPAGPANLDWGVWLMIYGGYAYAVAAALFYARTGK
jgi:hypothetical protein